MPRKPRSAAKGRGFCFLNIDDRTRLVAASLPSAGLVGPDARSCLRKVRARSLGWYRNHLVGLFS